MTTGVLIVEDHEIFRQGLVALIAEEPDIEVIGQAADGQSAVQAAAELQPDLVVMDLSLPEMNGIDATRNILEVVPEAKVLCLSIHHEVRFVERALLAGAVGYLVKDCAFEELIHGLRAVAADQVYLCPAVSRFVLDGYKSGLQGPDTGFSQLTAREREVLQRLAEGQCAKKIACDLGVSVKTIGTHREHLMSKLGLHSVAELTKYAIREGLTTVS